MEALGCGRLKSKVTSNYTNVLALMRVISQVQLVEVIYYTHSLLLIFGIHAHVNNKLLFLEFENQ